MKYTKAQWTFTKINDYSAYDWANDGASMDISSTASVYNGGVHMRSTPFSLSGKTVFRFAGKVYLYTTETDHIYIKSLSKNEILYVYETPHAPSTWVNISGAGNLDYGGDAYLEVIHRSYQGYGTSRIVFNQLLIE